MRRRKFKLFHLLAAVLVAAVCLAVFVEQKSVTGEPSTNSPDGNWSLELKLTEYSTLFRSRKVLDAAVLHNENSNWNVSTSVPILWSDGVEN